MEIEQAVHLPAAPPLYPAGEEARRAIEACGGLVGRDSLHVLWGVSRQRVQQIIAANPTFPRPVGKVGVTYVYFWGEVSQWSRANRGPDE